MSDDPYRPFDTALIVPTERLRKIYRLVQPVVEAVFGFPKLWKIYAQAKGAPAPAFAEACLEKLGTSWSTSDADRDRLRAIEGPVIACSNHPFGGIDSLSIIPMCHTVRPEGWRILSNFVVSDFPEFRDHLIAVDPLGAEGQRRANARGLATAMRFLRSGGWLGMFPAGRVSHFDDTLGAPFDQPWTGHAIRLAQSTNASLVILHIPGQNSNLFLKVPTRWSRFRALMLAREVGTPAVPEVQIRIAEIVPPDAVKKLTADDPGAARLQARCFLRSDLDVPRPSTPTAATAGDPPPPADNLSEAIAELARDARILQIGDRDILLFRGDEAPGAVMNELGRCREITFRAAGQGVGADIDLTPEDPYYHHLIVWNREAEELVGAYRMGKVQDIVRERGTQALYLDHIFDIDPELYDHLGAAFELSRSFVMPHYQRDNRALGALWRGLGEAALGHDCTTFFGSVTISDAHHPASRAILVEFLKRHYADAPELCRLVKARVPFAPQTRYHTTVADAFAGEKIDALAPTIDYIENGERSIPPLMRYYCTLGAKYLAYNVEPTFQDALYCLLRVDLNTIPAGYRKRFLGTNS